MKWGHVHDWFLTKYPMGGLVWVCKKCRKIKKFNGLNDEILKLKLKERRMKK